MRQAYHYWQDQPDSREPRRRPQVGQREWNALLTFILVVAGQQRPMSSPRTAGRLSFGRSLFSALFGLLLRSGCTRGAFDGRAGSGCGRLLRSRCSALPTIADRRHSTECLLRTRQVLYPAIEPSHCRSNGSEKYTTYISLARRAAAATPESESKPFAV